ncbi:hypothetical protein D2T29_08880 [Sinirhodobacter populi]|uniref:Lipoprotein n=1 Tax=Paenirhodobacter populi TaxID=2306993 RepID=A0A443KHQ9_9RHOB|nr:hypothetical protein [Sinirhodobacter populi]RWR32297.1 hypothetical protein D2T29_08880 [Sinirhodobacter populi]
MGQGLGRHAGGKRLWPWLALTALSACGPVPVEQAEAQCLARLHSDRPISGEAGMGVSDRGLRSVTKMTIDLKAGTGGDPSAAFDRCVYDRSGRMPTRPLYARTDWRG